MTLNESIPLRREPAADESAVGGELAWMGGLVLVALLALAVWAKLRRASAGSQDPNRTQLAASWLTRLQGRSSIAPSVLGSVRLTPAHTLHDVEWQGRRLLVGCSGQSIQVLSEVPGAVNGGEGSSQSGSPGKDDR